MASNDAQETTNQEFLEGFGDYVNGEEKKADAGNTAPKDYRGEIVKDNYNDFNDKFYGNPDVMASNKSALHGTHVSGIIEKKKNRWRWTLTLLKPAWMLPNKLEFCWASG